jgi:hypothetical protein
MAWIRDIPYDQAAPELKKLYDRYRNPDGTLDNIVTIHSLWPESRKAHFTLYTTALHGLGGLPRAAREMAGILVSASNRCRY